MDLLENKTLDYVEFELLDQHWKGYVVEWNRVRDLEIIVVADEKKFRIRPESETTRDRYVSVQEALVDLWDGKSLSEPHVTTVRFFLKTKRWGWWVAIPAAIFLYFSK